MAIREGIEPTVDSLTNYCCTSQLTYRIVVGKVGLKPTTCLAYGDRSFTELLSYKIDGEAETLWLLYKKNRRKNFHSPPNGSPCGCRSHTFRVKTECSEPLN